jgi:hypothetical protein
MEELSLSLWVDAIFTLSLCCLSISGLQWNSMEIGFLSGYSRRIVVKPTSYSLIPVSIAETQSIPKHPHFWSPLISGFHISKTYRGLAPAWFTDTVLFIAQKAINSLFVSGIECYSLLVTFIVQKSYCWIARLAETLATCFSNFFGVVASCSNRTYTPQLSSFFLSLSLP